MLPADAVSRLLTSCQRRLPSWASLRASDLTRISSGWECEIYSFTLEGDEAGERRREELILRVYPGNDGACKAAREFDVMSRLHRAGYPVPRMLVLESDDALLGNPFVVMEKIDGPMLGPIIQESSGERKQRLIALFCKLFADLHSLDWRPFVPDPAPYWAEGHELATVRTWRRILHQQFGKRELDPIVDWLEARSDEVRPRDLSLTHGDFHPWNILIRADGAPFVIDWTQADVSDPRLDLAWTLILMLTVAGPEMRDAVLAGYERATGSRVRDLWFFEAMASLKRVIGIWVSLTEGPEKVGMRPGAEEMMRQTGPHLATAYSVLRDRTGLAVPAVENLLATLA